jgi:putative endonuclease
MVDYRKKLGRSGENYAAAFLESTGYRILERNFRCRIGEVDIIAEKDEIIYFFEIKTRIAGQVGEEYSENQRKRLREVAENYLQREKIDQQVSFNIIGITGDPEAGVPQVEMIEDNYNL